MFVKKRKKRECRRCLRTAVLSAAAAIAGVAVGMPGAEALVSKQALIGWLLTPAFLADVK
jgi:hypothetical protein